MGMADSLKFIIMVIYSNIALKSLVSKEDYKSNMLRDNAR